MLKIKEKIRNIGKWVVVGSILVAGIIAAPQKVEAQNSDKPNILVIWGDDIGQSNISAYTMGLVGYRIPNIDRVAKEGMIFTDYYSEQSCTAGRSSFIIIVKTTSFGGGHV